MKPTLLILAAGVGSRYGGLKQLDPVGPAGEVIMDFSVFDALRAGFGKVVFVIRHDFEQQFKEQIGAKYARHIEVAYAFQDMHDLPVGFRVPAGRAKPWGTGHAILAAREVICEPFTMINADDFYGREAFEIIARQLTTTDVAGTHWCMVGYKIVNVLSAFGGVTRAMCEMQGDMLNSIAERFEITRAGDAVAAQDKQGTRCTYPLDALCSMNFFGFTPRLFPLLADGLRAFLAAHGTDMKAEYLIPTAVNALIGAGAARMRVLSCNASWFGVTYPDDKARVQESIRALVAQGAYPTPLWRA
jgi:dTDP-glucose pyrophosphorylase